MATINDLPNEILLLIFEHVPDKKELTQTCHRWNKLVGHMLKLFIDLSQAEDIEKFLKMKFTRPYQHLTIVGIMVMRREFHLPGPFLRSKRARYEVDPYEIIRKCLELTRQLEPHLTELSLWFGPMADQSLPAFLPRTGPSRLESLTIVFSCWFLEKPDDSAIDQLSTVAAKDCIAEVVEMPKLRKLHYEDRRSMGDRMIRRKFFDTLVRKAKGITEIMLQCSHYACYPDFRIMRSLSQQLQHVTCIIWPTFTAEFFQLTFPRAETMNLTFAYCTTAPDTAVRFFVNAHCLKDLTVANVHNSEFFQHGVSKCTQLEKLSINGRHEIAMDGLRSLDKLRELYLHSLLKNQNEQNAVPCSQSLEKLVLDRCTVGFSFYSVLASNVPQITELHITGDELFDDECLQAVCTTMVNLRRLKLTLMTFVEEPVTEDGFQSIGNLRKLEYLYLESHDRFFFSPTEMYSTIFTDWVQKVTASFIHLNNFRKFNLHDLLDLVLNPNLKNLVLEHCGNGIRLADGMKKLKQLNNDVPNVVIISDDW